MAVGPERRRILEELAFACLVAFAAAPLWVTEHLPIQDLPQHLAAVRVLHDYADDALGFRRFFEISLGHTQYLGYYFLVHLFAYGFDVVTANRIVLTMAVCALPYGARTLLDALGRDRGNAVFTLPLTYNAHLILGFANFVGALPLMLFGLATAVRFHASPSPRGAIALGLLAIATFYTHIVPFGVLALGVLLLGLGSNLGASLRTLAPLVPAAIAAAFWIGSTPAGGSVVTAVRGGHVEAGPRAQFASWGDALRDVPTWMTDVLRSRVDDRLLVGWLLLLLTAWIVSGAWIDPSLRTRIEPAVVRARVRVGLLAPLAGLLYFVTPLSHDWIWPISGRFPIIAALFLVVSVPPLPRRAALPLHVVVVALSIVGFVQVGRAFVAAEREEIAGLEETIASIPPGGKVAGLMWNRDSKHVNFSPYLHSVAWYQVRRGGAVMFTFAELPQSPFRYRASNRPEPVPRHWEWLPGKVHPEDDLVWFDFLLTRGTPPRRKRHEKAWEVIVRRGAWTAWKRRVDGSSADSADDAAEASLPRPRQ